MDTSPEYINMCRQARELQEMWEPEPGDFYKLPGRFITCIVLKNSLIDMDAIWLPRIDQILQHISEIPQWTHYKGYELMYKVLDYYSNYFTRGKDSYEQSFVQILYSEKYNKSWNGEDWI